MKAKTMLIRMTGQQHTTVTRAAKEAGMSLSQYAVTRMIGDGLGAPAVTLKAAERSLEQALRVLRRSGKTAPQEQVVVLDVPEQSGPTAEPPIPEGSSGVEAFVLERCNPERGATLQCVTGEELVREFYQWALTRTGVEDLTPQQVKVWISRLLGTRSTNVRRGEVVVRVYKIPLLRTT